MIEDRDSQITMSVLGQEAPLQDKQVWDPDFEKRRTIKAILDPMVPEFSVGMGGASSIVSRARRGRDRSRHQSRELAAARLACRNS